MPGVNRIEQLDALPLGFHLASDLLAGSAPLAIGAAGLAKRHMAARRAARGHNDEPVPTTVGADQGRPVDWMPEA